MTYQSFFMAAAIYTAVLSAAIYILGYTCGYKDCHDKFICCRDKRGRFVRKS